MIDKINGETSCVFCEIINGTAQAAEIREYAEVTSFIPLNPVVEGHRIFVPHKHSNNAAEDANLAGKVFAAAAMHGSHSNEHFNLITSNGSDATQTVFHLHVHYVPRSSGDNLSLPWDKRL